MNFHIHSKENQLKASGGSHRCLLLLACAVILHPYAAGRICVAEQPLQSPFPPFAQQSGDDVSGGQDDSSKTASTPKGNAGIVAAGEIADGDNSNQSSSPNVKEIDAIVARLAARSFRERESAMAEILAIGPAALPALQRQLDAEDVELKRRVEIITERLLSDDFEARVDAFLEAQDGATLPGWDYFKTKVGARIRHREIFVELSRRHPGAVVLFDGTGEDRREAFKLILAGIGPVIRDPNPADAIALLLLSVDDEIEPTLECASHMRMLFNYYSVANVIQQPEFQPSIRRLLNKWILKVSEPLWMVAVQLAGRWNLEAAPELAEKVLAKTEQPELLLQTFVLLADNGRPEYSRWLVPYLDDKTRIQSFYTDESGRGIQVFLGDVAMATIGKLNQRSLRDLGFPFARETADGFFDIASVGFAIGKVGNDARKRVRSDIDEILEDLNDDKQPAAKP